MKERPILFSGPMVCAILSRTKRQTRRICKPAQFYCMSQVVEVPDPLERGQVYNGSHFGDEEGDVQFASPYGGRGDRLWVRETFAHLYRDNIAPTSRHPEDVAYRADGLTPDPYVFGSWKPSIHMPRWASRITLEITSVRVERLQDVSEADALAEGIVQLRDGGFGLPAGEHYHATDPRISYWSLWDHINGPGSVDANPWVWVVEWPALLNTTDDRPSVRSI
jgi:hypothetical protein